MKIALFLDVDKTLTKRYIQEDYARLLGCSEEYEIIEGEFQRTQSSEKFGDELINLFKSYSFTSAYARKNFEQIQLLPWTDLLLKLPVTKFLVSNGPSYYIDMLAQKYNIPQENVIRSYYRFNNDTDLIEGCNAVSNAGKAEFVSEKAKDFDITIGVGDSPRHDGPFLTNCTFGFIHQTNGYPIQTDQENNSFLFATSIERVIRFTETIDSIKNLRSQMGIQDIKVKDILMNSKITAMRYVWLLFATIFGAGAIFGFFVKTKMF